MTHVLTTLSQDATPAKPGQNIMATNPDGDANTPLSIDFLEEYASVDTTEVIAEHQALAVMRDHQCAEDAADLVEDDSQTVQPEPAAILSEPEAGELGARFGFDQALNQSDGESYYREKSTDSSWNQTANAPKYLTECWLSSPNRRLSSTVGDYINDQIDANDDELKIYLGPEYIYPERPVGYPTEDVLIEGSTPVLTLDYVNVEYAGSSVSSERLHGVDDKSQPKSEDFFKAGASLIEWKYSFVFVGRVSLRLAETASKEMAALAGTPDQPSFLSGSQLAADMAPNRVPQASLNMPETVSPGGLRFISLDGTESLATDRHASVSDPWATNAHPQVTKVGVRASVVHRMSGSTAIDTDTGLDPDVQDRQTVLHGTLTTPGAAKGSNEHDMWSYAVTPGNPRHRAIAKYVPVMMGSNTIGAARRSGPDSKGRVDHVSGHEKPPVDHLPDRIPPDRAMAPGGGLRPSENNGKWPLQPKIAPSSSSFSHSGFVDIASNPSDLEMDESTVSSAGREMTALRADAVPSQGTGLSGSFERGTAQVLSQIADAIRREAPGMIELRLEPEELGRLRIAITAGEAGMSLQFQSDRSETMDLLRRNGAELERIFAEAGLDLEGFAFGFGSSAKPLFTKEAHTFSDDRVEEDTSPSPHESSPNGPSSVEGMDLRM